ncbi:MAG: type II secretion system protein [Pseudomonadota bacterium]
MVVIFLPTFVTAKQRGASLLEFGVAVAVIGILMTILLQRIWYYQDEAERTSVQLTVANVRAALEIKVTQGKLPGRSVDLTILAEQNPLNLLVAKPVNYAGEYFSPRNGEVSEGNWYFDRSNKTLVYLLNIRNSFGGAQSKRLKFKVKLLRLPYSPAKPSGTPESLGVAFEQVND